MSTFRVTFSPAAGACAAGAAVAPPLDDGAGAAEPPHAAKSNARTTITPMKTELRLYITLLHDLSAVAAFAISWLEQDLHGSVAPHAAPISISLSNRSPPCKLASGTIRCAANVGHGKDRYASRRPLRYTRAELWWNLAVVQGIGMEMLECKCQNSENSMIAVLANHL